MPIQAAKPRKLEPCPVSGSTVRNLIRSPTLKSPAAGVHRARLRDAVYAAQPSQAHAGTLHGELNDPAEEICRLDLSMAALRIGIGPMQEVR